MQDYTTNQPEGKAYKTGYDMIYAVRQWQDGSYRIMCHYDDTPWMLATDPRLSAPCGCAESLQEVLDAHALRMDWKEFELMCKKNTPAPKPAAAAMTTAPAAAPMAATPTTPADAASSAALTSRADSGAVKQGPPSVAAACSAADLQLIQPETVYISPEGIRYRIASVTINKKQYFRTERYTDGEWRSVNSAVYASLRAANEEFEAWIKAEKLEQEAPPLAEGNTVIQATPEQSPAFDYTGLDKQTVTDLHLAEREYAVGKRLAEMGLRRMADGVAIAHEALCGTVVHNVDNGQFTPKDDTFRAWCESIGVSKSTAYKLLQVSTLFDQSTPRQQKVLAELAPSLLYAAAKPSAPAELVQAVKDGDITTHKQYQELLAQLKAAQAEQQQTAQALAAKDAAMQQAQEKAKQYHAQASELTEALSAAHQVRDNAQNRAARAEAERDAARQQAAEQAARVQELEARPVEVVGASPEDIARWRAEGARAAQRELKQAQAEAQRQRRRAEEAEQDAEAAGQESLSYCQQLADTRQELEAVQAQAAAVTQARQAATACEALLNPCLAGLDQLPQAEYEAAWCVLRDVCLWLGRALGLVEDPDDPDTIEDTPEEEEN